MQCAVDSINGKPRDELSCPALSEIAGLGLQSTRASEIVKQRDPIVLAAIEQALDGINQVIPQKVMYCSV